MDKASDLTDAYVEVRFADLEAQRTTVCRKTLNPVWNEVCLSGRLASCSSSPRPCCFPPRDARADTNKLNTSDS